MFKSLFKQLLNYYLKKRFCTGCSGLKPNGKNREKDDLYSCATCVPIRATNSILKRNIVSLTKGSDTHNFIVIVKLSRSSVYCSLRQNQLTKHIKALLINCQNNIEVKTIPTDVITTKVVKYIYRKMYTQDIFQRWDMP